MLVCIVPSYPALLLVKDNPCFGLPIWQQPCTCIYISKFRDLFAIEREQPNISCQLSCSRLFLRQRPIHLSTWGYIKLKTHSEGAKNCVACHSLSLIIVYNLQYTTVASIAFLLRNAACMLPHFSKNPKIQKS